MLQNDNALHKALAKLANSYDYMHGNWRHSSFELRKVAEIISERTWTKELRLSLIRSIHRRINRRYPTTAIRQNSGHCTQHIAENAVKNIRKRILLSSKQVVREVNFLYIDNYV